MNINHAYVSYGKYYLDYNTIDYTLKAGYGKCYIEGRLTNDILSVYDNCEIIHSLDNTGIEKKVIYQSGSRKLVITFRADNNGISIKSEPGVYIDAVFTLAQTEDLLAVRMHKNSSVINCSLGNAVSKFDNAVFDKNTDTAAVIHGDDAFIEFDFDKDAYVLRGKADFRLESAENVYAGKYKITYGRLNKKNTFGSLPPVGWMSWYAVKFDASEKTVLENAAFQSKHLKDFGANAIWVDWEWYHKGFYVSTDWVHKEFYEENPRDDGVDTFHPDKQKYPNGLKAVSDKIKELGLIPALWIGFTHETWETDYIKEHPEIVVTAEPTWVGIYFYDITHPVFLNDFLPKALAQVEQWGYDAVKFDTLPICMEMTERYHERLYDPTLTTGEAYRNMITKTREILGKDMYMLSCSGTKRSDILWGADLFDAARIGDDIFKWDEFITNCIMRTLEFYSLNNVVLYNDPDNVIIREEFNTMNQAISRAVFVSMLGMPITFGDNLPDLPEERLNILKRVIPALDISPKDMEARVDRTDIQITNLNINQKWENYNVISVFNTTEEPRQHYLNLQKDAELEHGMYHIYDFWHDEYLGCVSEGINLDLEECETRVLSVRCVKSHPQIVSTSRHITQGAAEIVSYEYAEGVLTLECNLIKGDEYKVALYIPQGYEIADSDRFTVNSSGDMTYLKFIPEETTKHKFKILFKNN